MLFASIIRKFNVYGSVHRKYILIYIQQDATLHSLFTSENCSTCFWWYFHPLSGEHKLYLQHLVFVRLRHPQHTQTGSNSSTIAADISNGVTNTRCCRYSLCAPDNGWKYHLKHVKQFPDINKLCNIVSCWIYIGIILGAHHILHISRIGVKVEFSCIFVFLL
jgi:hypothetical protein